MKRILSSEHGKMIFSSSSLFRWPHLKQNGIFWLGKSAKFFYLSIFSPWQKIYAVQSKKKLFENFFRPWRQINRYTSRTQYFVRYSNFFLKHFSLGFNEIESKKGIYVQKLGSDFFFLEVCDNILMRSVLFSHGSHESCLTQFLK